MVPWERIFLEESYESINQNLAELVSDERASLCYRTFQINYHVISHSRSIK